MFHFTATYAVLSIFKRRLRIEKDLYVCIKMSGPLCLKYAFQKFLNVCLILKYQNVKSLLGKCDNCFLV